MESATAAPAAQEKKSWFETVVISTPVLLTVIATFLIGQSSSEMTRAQYFRAVASQNQSKVGDQWGFFQAKRIRGQILEGNADLLLAQNRAPFSRDTFVDAAQVMVKELRHALRDVETPNNNRGRDTSEVSKTSEVSGGAKPSSLEKDIIKELSGIARDLKALLGEAENSLALTKSAFNPPADGWNGERHVLTPKNVQAALDALETKSKKNKGIRVSKDSKVKESAKTSEVSETSEVLAIAADQAALLKEIIDDIQKRKHESEIAPKVLKLTDETLNQAIKAADSRADEVYRQGKSIENVLEEFDSLVERQTALAFDYQQIAARLKPLLEKTEPDSQDKTPEIRKSLVQIHAALERRADAIRALNAKLQGDFKAARHAYGARRYEDDARSNQESAYLYEVKVQLSSARSDKHLYRSKMFLLAMLVAQAGVTIATLAMAVKRKSIFWLLATLTGIIAIGFGTYVYLDLWPIPTF
jgi:hypothetical protein